MSLQRIMAMLRQEQYITLRSVEVIVDLGFFALIYLVIFGYISIYLAGSDNVQAAEYILIGMILWEVVRISQYSISVGSLWNIWSRNLSNIFVSPITVSEYLVAYMFSGIMKMAVLFVLMAFITIHVFNFNIFSLGFINLAVYIINLLIFSWSLGLVALGFIFRFGSRIQALAWSISYIFQPLSGAFFPVSVLPSWLQKLSYILPPTYVFESARQNITNHTTDWHGIAIAFILNVIYFFISLKIFNILFQQSKISGQFARNEG